MGICVGALASALVIQFISLLSEYSSPRFLISGLLSPRPPTTPRPSSSSSSLVVQGDSGDPNRSFLNQQPSSSSASRTIRASTTPALLAQKQSSPPLQQQQQQWSLAISSSKSLSSSATHNNQKQQQQQQQQVVVQPIVFVHFHKSGGTEACQTMLEYSKRDRENHLQLTDDLLQSIKGYPRNCNAQHSGPFTDSRMGLLDFHLTCDHLLPYTTNQEGSPFTRNNFVAMEIPMNIPFPCRQFRNLALMRHPIDRAQSHMKVRKWTETHVQQAIAQHTNITLMPMTAITKKKHVDAIVQMTFPCMNNMVIRQLLGYEYFVNYTRPITHVELEQAKHIVNQFTAFLPTEQQLHPKALTLLEQEIPEYHSAITSDVVVVKRNKRKETTQKLHGSIKSNNKYNPSPEFLILLFNENKYDLLLYKYIHE